MSPEISLSSPQLQTTDYLDYDNKTTFHDLVNQLKEKYSTEVLNYVKQFQNIRNKLTLEHVTVKLHFIDEQGIKRTVGLKTMVAKIMGGSQNPRIYWEPEPIGGKIN